MVVLGYTLNLHDTIDSTSEEAKRLIKAGSAVDRLAIVAKEQSAGHGRYEREWQSLEGNLHMSLLLRMEDELKDIGQLSFVSAVALGEVMNETMPDVDIKYKWPNDVLVDGKKIAGILLEYLHGWLVVGIGVNVAVVPDVANPVTSIQKCGNSDINCDIVLEKLLNSFDNSFNLWKKSGFKPIRDKWISRAFKHNEEITVNFGSETLTGIFANVNGEGNLELLTGRGLRIVSAGEVFF